MMSIGQMAPEDAHKQNGASVDGGLQRAGESAVSGSPNASATSEVRIGTSVSLPAFPRMF